MIFLFTTVIPLSLFGKLALRESIAVWILSDSGTPTAQIVYATLIIWIINLVIPALMGAYFFSKLKVEKK